MNLKTLNQSTTKIRAVFFQVGSAREKIETICREVEAHYLKNHRILIYAESKDALDYVDRLLWSYREESFLPHIIANEPCQELIVLTQEKANLNEARSVLNLGLDPIEPFDRNVQTLYELEDTSSPAKKKIYQMKFDFYKTAGHHIISQ